MKNREKFKEVFGIEARWSNTLTPQIEALSSIVLKGISCAGEWLESEYKEQPTATVISIPNNATIGDVIEAILPNAEVNPNPYIPSVDIYMGGILMMRVDRNLYNASYKKVAENESSK